MAFNPSKTKLVRFNHKQANPEFPPVKINGCILNEAHCLEGLLELKLIPDFKQNFYI